MTTASGLQGLISSAQARIDELNRSIDDARANNRALDTKIEALKTAKQHAEWAGFNAYQLKECLNTVQPGEWAGTNWDKFRNTTHGGDTYASIDELHRRCDELRDEIQAQISAAEAQKNHLADIIGSARDSIDLLGNSIASFTRQLNRMDRS